MFNVCQGPRSNGPKAFPVHSLEPFKNTGQVQGHHFKEDFSHSHDLYNGFSNWDAPDNTKWVLFSNLQEIEFICCATGHYINYAM